MVLKYWWVGEAPFHGGWLGMLSAFIIAGFSFQGTELVGILAGECKNPQETIPKAIKQIFWRILLFFVLSIFVISLLIPYTSTQLINATVATSPFTLVFKEMGISFAASLVNFIILIAILSAGNAGMYAAARMLWCLAQEKYVPAIFAKTNKRGIPIAALTLSTLVAMLTFLSSLFGNKTVYFWLVNAVSVSGFIAWMGIAISHYRFRKAYLKQNNDLSALPFLAKGYPFAPLCAFVICIFLIVGQNYQALLEKPINWYGVLVSYIGVPIFLFLWLGYKVIKKTKIVDLHACDFEDRFAK